MLYFSEMVGVRNFWTTTCLVLALLTPDLEGRRRPSVKRALQTIDNTITSTGRNVKSRVGKISDYLDSEEGSSQMDTVCSSLETIGGAVSSLTSGDTLEIVSGTLDVISAATALIPVAGPIISTVFSLIGTIFGAIAGGGGESEDVGTVVKKEIEKALNKYDDSELKAEAEGAMRVFRNSHAYLNVMEGDSSVDENAIQALSCNVPVYQGIGFLGMLSQKMETNSKSNDQDQVKRAMEYLQLYITLAIMRSSILWEMYALVKSAPGNNFTADAIRRVIVEEEKHDKSFLNFMQGPDYPQALYFALFNASEWPTTMAFIEKKGLIYQYQHHGHLANTIHPLRPEKWTNKYMVMMNDASGTMGGTETLNAQSQFYFDPISNENNVFYLKSNEWPTWYVYMKDDKDGYCSGWNGKPGLDGEWKVIRFKDGKYMLSPKKWPNMFIYMDNDYYGHIRGSKGDPGIQGHWLIDSDSDSWTSQPKTNSDDDKLSP